MSKKFDAAKKHFDAIEMKLRQDKNKTIAQYERMIEEHQTEFDRLKKMEIEHQILLAKYNRLLEYSKLSDEDMKNAILKDESIVSLMQAMNFINRRL